MYRKMLLWIETIDFNEMFQNIIRIYLPRYFTINGSCTFLGFPLINRKHLTTMKWALYYVNELSRNYMKRCVYCIWVPLESFSGRKSNYVQRWIFIDPSRNEDEWKC